MRHGGDGVAVAAILNSPSVALKKRKRENRANHDAARLFLRVLFTIVLSMSDKNLLPTGPVDALITQEDPLGDPVYLWDTSNPKSVINLVPPGIKEAMLRFINERPDLVDLDEQMLKKKIREETGTNCTATDNQVRMNFWVEHGRAVFTGKRMNVVGLVYNICSVEFFNKTFLKNNYKVAWMVCPIVNFIVKATESLDFGLGELRETLAQPHIQGNSIDHKLLNAKISIVKLLDARVNGAAVQRNLNVTRQQIEVMGTATGEERERLIDQHIRQLEKNINGQLVPDNKVKDGI